MNIFNAQMSSANCASLSPSCGTYPAYISPSLTVI